MGRPISRLRPTPEERAELERRAQAGTTPQRDGLRARIVLLRAAGMRQEDVARQVGTSAQSVNKWPQRFARDGLAGLRDRSGRGRKPSVALEKVERVITEAGRAPPGRQRWSSRRLAAEVGMSASSAQRIWRRHDLKPHLRRTFKLSSGKRFEEKFWDVIGLYLDPPEKALVLRCDEKTQCRALERTQPGLPLGIGHVRTHTHDYIRHGTVTLFVALNYLEGWLIGRTETRHTHVEWLRFLKQIDRETPQELDVHLIVDNYCTHKHAKVRAWLAGHARFHVHFTPTSGSWMNLVERFFADLTEDVARAGSFRSVRQLATRIERYLAERNADPKPYR